MTTVTRHIAAVVGAVIAAAGIAAGSLAAPPAEILAPPAAGDAAKPADLDTPEARLGYALGLRIGGRIAADFKSQQAPVDPAALARGLADAILGIKPRLDEAKIAEALEGFEARMREQQREFAKRMADVGKANKAKAAEFLKANAAKQGVVSLPSGLQYEVLKAGAGPQPKSDDTVSTHYRGTHLDGTEFDATDPKGEPATFPLRGVVPGWQEALPLMKVGSKWRLYVPPELGYGEEGSPPVIEPHELLVFEIELVEIAPR
jgi:FKBP-type peptidyl-prolyl cis-trans isomerase FklB